MTQDTLIDQWIKELWDPENEEERLLAIVDGCKAGDLIMPLVHGGRASHPLATGSGNEEWYKALPWLFEMEPEDDLLRELLRNYGKGWAIFLRTEAALEKIAEHFTSLATAVLPNGNSTWFRYYEPCFFRAFAKYSGEDNLKRLYGDKVNVFYAENPRKAIFESFRPPDHGRIAVKPGNYLRLSPEILERLDDARMDELKRILGIRYMRDIPQDALTSESRTEIERNLGELVERAAGHGIKDIKSLSILAEVAGHWGMQFDEEIPEVREILTNPGIQGWARALFVKQLLEKSTGDNNER